MLGFKFFTENIFGLPERTEVIGLHETSEDRPYRMYDIDVFPHDEFAILNLYSGIPYIHGHD